ncbi:MAG: class II aldolase/adducin family protein [Clostridia bacterium]|nr:class II aldolase/adducin family protein [Clostridia bacterium]
MQSNNEVKKSSGIGPVEDSIEVRQQIIDTCLWLVEKGLVVSTWGNISVRLNDGNILITPSRIAYHEMQPEDLVVLAPDGTVVKGFRLSTSERELHRGILNARPDVHAVIHTHSTYAMACCAMEGGIPAFSEEMAQLLGGAIPLSKAFVPSEQHVNLGKMAVESIGNANALLLRNHGPVCLGRSLEEAKACAQIVEKSAKIYMHIRAAGEPCLLEDKWVKAGRAYFTDAYGKT